MAVEAVAEQPERQDNGDKNKGFVTFEPSRDTQGFGTFGMRGFVLAVSGYPLLQFEALFP